jgi:hypothetical protein
MFRERRRKWEWDWERSKQRRHYELTITAAGGRLPPPQKIAPPRKIGPPRSKLAPGYYRYVTDQSLAERQKRAVPKLTPPRSKLAPAYRRYVTLESLAEGAAREAQAREALQGEERRRRDNAAKILGQRRKLVGEGKPPVLNEDLILHGSPTWPLIERWDSLSPDEREHVTERWIAEQEDPFSARAKMERG